MRNRARHDGTVLPLARGELDLPPTCSRDAVRDAAARDGAFDVRDEVDLVLARRRLLGNRGILRLLRPKCTTRMSFQQGSARYVVRLDGLGLFMLIVIIGGVIVELTMDRARYPREYPPALVFALAAGYVVTLAVEVAWTNSGLQRILEAARARSTAQPRP